MWAFTVVFAALFLFAASMLNRLTLILAPIALASVLLYSFTKRWTQFSHIVLGWCLAIAPTGAWIAVRGEIGSPVPLLLSLVVLLWTAISGWRAGTPRWGDVVLAAIGGCAILNAALMVFAFTRVRMWRRRSKNGQLEAERCEAFRRYLTDFPRLQEAPPATLELWERFLVYGIAFGIAERVLQGAQLHMPEELHNASSIYWIKYGAPAR